MRNSDASPSRNEPPLATGKHRTLDWHNIDLPYGVWDRADGSQVLFDRNYVPQLERDPDVGSARLAQPVWVSWSRQRWFWGSGGLGFPSIKKPPPGHAARKHGEAVIAAFVAGASIDPFILDPAPEI
jgi:hypothetical protein